MRFPFREATLLARCFADRFQLAGWELVVGRLLMAWYLWGGLPFAPADFTAQPTPVGLAQWIDFTWLANPASFQAALLCAKVGVLLFAAGVAVPVGLGAFLFLDVSMNTLTSSQGIHGHGGNLNALIALALLAGHLYHAGRHRAWLSLLYAGKDSGQAAFRAGRCMLAATYVVGGMSKILNGGWDWWNRAECFVAQVCKAQDEVLSTWTDPRLAESARAFGQFLEAHPGAAKPMLAAAMLMELGAFLACTTRLRALLLGLGLAAFHQMNGWLMGLPFPSNTQMLLVFFILPLSWMVHLAGLVRLRLPVQVPETPQTPPVSRGRPFSMLVQSPALSIVFASFLWWRQDWYPFSNFPMYSVLPPGTYSLFATDMEDRLLPFDQLGIDSRALKKMINSELKKFKADRAVRRMADLNEQHWQEASARVVNRMRDTWNNPAISDTSFKIHCKYYDAGDSGLTITTREVGRFPARTPGKVPTP